MAYHRLNNNLVSASDGISAFFFVSLNYGIYEGYMN